MTLACGHCKVQSPTHGRLDFEFARVCIERVLCTRNQRNLNKTGWSQEEPADCAYYNMRKKKMSIRRSSLEQIAFIFDAARKMLYREPAVARLSFEDVYRTIFNAILEGHGGELYQHLKRLMTEYMDELATKNADILEKSNEEIASIVLLEWKDFLQALTMLKDCFMYLDRAYTRQHGLAHIHDLGCGLFEKTVLTEPIKSALQGQESNAEISSMLQVLEAIPSDESQTAT